MSPFDRFDEEGRRALARARAEAEAAGDRFLGAEHVLLALVAEPTPRCREAFSRLHVAVDPARRAVRAHVGGRSPTLDTVPAPRGGKLLPFTDRAKRVLEEARHEAESSGSKIGPEALLLGLVRDGGGVAWLALRELGVGPEEVRAALAASPAADGA